MSIGVGRVGLMRVGTGGHGHGTRRRVIFSYDADSRQSGERRSEVEGRLNPVRSGTYVWCR